MKKVPALFLAFLLLFSLLAGCSGGPSAATAKPSAAPSAEPTPPPRSEEMWFQNGEKKIYAKMFLPAEEKDKYPPWSSATVSPGPLRTT